MWKAATRLIARCRGRQARNSALANVAGRDARIQVFSEVPHPPHSPKLRARKQFRTFNPGAVAIATKPLSRGIDFAEESVTYAELADWIARLEQLVRRFLGH
jgi:hypothetical protein